MVIIRKKELREMTLEQLDEKLSELATELGKMKSQVRSGGAPENPGRMGEIGRTIARIETFKTQKTKKDKGAAMEKPEKKK